jgi:hypothetical protein
LRILFWNSFVPSSVCAYWSAYLGANKFIENWAMKTFLFFWHPPNSIARVCVKFSNKSCTVGSGEMSLPGVNLSRPISTSMLGD